ncbi:MAG: SDR family oxidoreductase [Hyphomicrobiales bacterium]
MKIGVTGANGFIGRALVSELAEKEHEPVALVRRADRGPAGAEARVLGDLGPAPVDPALLCGLDVIIHLAARVHVMRDSAADPLAAFRAVNTAGAVRLAEAAHAAGVRRFVFVSTIRVNGAETPYRNGRGRPFTSFDIPAPTEPYGLSKAEAERQLAALSAATGLEVPIVRPPLVYGPGAKGNFARLAGWVARGMPLPLALVDNKRSLVALDNLVDMLVAVATHPAAREGTFLVSDDDDLSTPELIARIGRAIGRPARLFAVPVPLLRAAGALLGRRGEVRRLTTSLQVDMADTKARLGWHPPVAVDAAIASAVAGLTGGGR